MNKDKYIQMSSDELNDSFLAHIMNSPVESQQIIEELILSRRYVEDFEFRTYVDTGKTMVDSLFGNYMECISEATGLVERSMMLELWKLVAVNLNIIGNAYYVFRMNERAMEFFLNVIQCEKEHGITSMTVAVYNNISLIYMELGEYHKSKGYLKLALESLEAIKEKNTRYEAQKCYCLSYLMICDFELKKKKEVEKTYRLIQGIDEEQLDPFTKYVLRFAQMYYYFIEGKYDLGKQAYLEAKEVLEKNTVTDTLDVVAAFINLCSRFKLDCSFYADEVEMIEEGEEKEQREKKEHSSFDTEVYKVLRKFYRQTKNKEKLKKTTTRYIQRLEKDVELTKSQQLESIDVICEIREKQQSFAAANPQNKEIHLIAEEAIRTKNDLQKMYRRMEIINTIGQKITSCLKLEEVIDVIYQNVYENIPVDAFILMVVEPEHQHLRSVAFYEDNDLREDFMIPLEKEDSIFADCYHKNEWIILRNIPYDDYFFEKTWVQRAGDIKSAIFIPLVVGEQIIGLCSIQNKEINAFTKEHQLFFKQLSPYLSIALNNAVRSWKLEGEIRSHLKTQVELEKANYRLELLSSLDGLTQISSRRDFETKVLKMIREAEESRLSFSIFMCDIDFFKMYNDSYGHLEGDEVLKIVAQNFRKNVDMVGGLTARFGGEEFIGACIGLNHMDARKLANQICLDIYDMNIENEKAPLGRVTISIGVAVVESATIGLKSDIIRLADKCLYNAKNTGKNKVVLRRLIHYAKKGDYYTLDEF